jgi:ATP-binding cassette subfamily A (ABC1) protein 3
MTTDLIHCLEEENSNSSIVCDVLAAIVFNSLDTTTNFSYSIRLTSSPRNSRSLPFSFDFQDNSNWNTRKMFPKLQKIGPREEASIWGGQPGYMSEGFLTLQHHIDIALMRLVNVTAAEQLVNVHLQRHPYPPYLSDNFVLVIQQQLPTILLLSLVFSALQIVKEVVHEKERKLKV